MKENVNVWACYYEEINKLTALLTICNLILFTNICVGLIQSV